MQKYLVAATSCRAIVRSIVQSGFHCAGIDLFADWDSRQMGPVVQCQTLDEVFQVAGNFDPNYEVVFGAGVVNRLDRLNSQRAKRTFSERICGADFSAIQAVRNPCRVANCLERAGLPCLVVSMDRPTSGNWIVKPIASGGGHSVHRLADALSRSPNESFYFQRFVEGPVYGVSFVAFENETRWIGVCQQQIQPLGNNEFCYHGSIGPLKMSRDVQDTLLKIGECISRDSGLRGWFGVDFILKDGFPWVLEVNPRFTASMELHERVARRSLFPTHAAAVQGENVSDVWKYSDANRPQTGHVMGKRYVYNRFDSAIQTSSGLFTLLKTLSVGEDLFVTDIPVPGQILPPNDPVCTVWAVDKNPHAVQEKLKTLEDQVLLAAISDAVQT